VCVNFLCYFFGYVFALLDSCNASVLVSQHSECLVLLSIVPGGCTLLQVRQGVWFQVADLMDYVLRSLVHSFCRLTEYCARVSVLLYIYQVRLTW